MKKQIILGIASAVLVAAPAFADTVTTTFGPLAQGNFGGTGIANNPSEVTTITSDTGGDQIVLGLTATPRYNNAPASQNFMLLNNGAGTFYTPSGLNNGLFPTMPHSLATTWNYDYYVSNSGGSLANYTFQLLLQTTPGGAFTTVPITLTAGVFQDSENLSFQGPAFNPVAVGDYVFKLEALNGGTVVGESDITVEVVPEISSTAALFALTLGGLGVYSRMRRQSVA